MTRDHGSRPTWLIMSFVHSLMGGVLHAFLSYNAEFVNPGGYQVRSLCGRQQACNGWVYIRDHDGWHKHNCSPQHMWGELWKCVIFILDPVIYIRHRFPCRCVSMTCASLYWFLKKWWFVIIQDSLLASPIILDLVILTELCQRITFRTQQDQSFQSFHSVLSLLSFLCKAPLVPPNAPVVNAFFRQRACIENVMRYRKCLCHTDFYHDDPRHLFWLYSNTVFVRKKIVKIEVSDACFSH